MAKRHRRSTGSKARRQREMIRWALDASLMIMRLAQAIKAMASVCD